MWDLRQRRMQKAKRGWRTGGCRRERWLLASNVEEEHSETSCSAQGCDSQDGWPKALLGRTHCRNSILIVSVSIGDALRRDVKFIFMLQLLLVVLAPKSRHGGRPSEPGAS